MVRSSSPAEPRASCKKSCMSVFVIQDWARRRRLCLGLRELLQKPPLASKRVVVPILPQTPSGMSLARSTGPANKAATLHAEVVDLLQPRWLLDVSSAQLWQRTSQTKELLRFDIAGAFGEQLGSNVDKYIRMNGFLFENSRNRNRVEHRSWNSPSHLRRSLRVRVSRQRRLQSSLLPHFVACVSRYLLEIQREEKTSPTCCRSLSQLGTPTEPCRQSRPWWGPTLIRGPMALAQALCMASGVNMGETVLKP